MTSYWSPLPLYLQIVEMLSKKDGALTDDELYQGLQRAYGELSQRELNKTLMWLELEGTIHVTNLTKKRRRVELAHMWDP